MIAPQVKAVRCAIYTRVSTDNGLDQDFNSLDAQYDAGEAYIRSQAHAHWTLVRSRYDDGGFSGGSTDRPALQQLLTDVKANKVNVIVVYKVDRLTRSLADFAKLVELFDQHKVSFVSVTQQFNTTTSMGRLTLNVLLSFAQFEREVTSERIRDKVAASKRKGLWVGGPVPIGYALKDGKLVIIEEEAQRVKMIFRRYLDLGSVNRLVTELGERNVLTKQRQLSNGTTTGGVPFCRGSLFYLLRNCFYIGKVRYKDEILAGPQPPLMERALFDAVQQKLTDQWSHRNVAKNKTYHPLAGLLFDDTGHPMVATHATKNGVRYRYYVSRPHLQGLSRTATLGSVSRVPAATIEEVITKAFADHYRQEAIDILHPSDLPDGDRKHDALVFDACAHIARIDVHKNELLLRLRSRTPPKGLPTVEELGGEPKELNDHPDEKMLRIAWRKPPGKRFREILLPSSDSRQLVRPIRAERRVSLIAAIAKGRRWLNQIVIGTVLSAEDIAIREKCSVRQVNLTISLAFLAPGLVKAAVEGRLPRGVGVGVERLRDPAAEWRRQFESLGLAVG
jgi:site-specific DNA recombinase